MKDVDSIDVAIRCAADAISSADAILIGAGAGMGVDSGLPDFRGDQGFWNAYPPFRGRKFSQMSNPVWFRTDPSQAWGFFGHRLNLYRRTSPHRGFDIIRKWCESRPCGHFVYTSNVDGHFQRAGFPAASVVECHGSIHYLQCSDVCSPDILPADHVSLEIDEETIRAAAPFPTCGHCSSIARPNILMFGDFEWIPDRCEDQHQRYVDWLRSVEGRRLAIIEFGAGLAIPSVRYECESKPGQLIRVNPRDHAVPPAAISIPLGALEAVERIDALMPTDDEH